VARSLLATKTRRHKIQNEAAFVRIGEDRESELAKVILCSRARCFAALSMTNDKVSTEHQKLLRIAERFFDLLVEHTQLYVDSAEHPIDIVQRMDGLVVAFIH